MAWQQAGHKGLPNHHRPYRGPSSCRWIVFLRPAVWLDDFVPAGMANGAWWELHVEGDLFGHEGFLGIEHHIPRDFLAGVSGSAGHHGHEGGGDHSVAGVERVAVADGGVHFVVLGLVAVVVALVFVAGGPAPFQSIGV